MDQLLFHGVCTALVTPFWNNQINYPLLQQLIERQIKANVPAIVLAGTTGEAPTLSDYEKIELFKMGKQYAAGRCRVIAGTGSNNTEHTIALSIAAKGAGVDGLLIVSPYYNKATPEGLCAHYTAVAQAVDLPIIIYNVPSRTNVDIPVAVYKKLSELPNIVGVKECTTDICKVTKIRNACGDAFRIWTGNDEHTVPAMALGASGVISVASNVCPEQMVCMCEAAFHNDYDIASGIQTELMALLDLLFCEVNPIPVKTAMRLIGYDCGNCRLPLTALSPENHKELLNFFS